MPMQPFAFDWDGGSMQQAEQWNWLRREEMAECRRCAEAGDEAHDRLALILLDHLVEVVIGREVDGWPCRCADSVVEEMRNLRTTADSSGELNRLVDEHVGPDSPQGYGRPPARRKTKFLKQKGVLTVPEREVLDRLHQYRNGAAAAGHAGAGPDLDLVLAYRVLADELVGRHRPVAWTLAS